MTNSIIVDIDCLVAIAHEASTNEPRRQRSVARVQAGDDAAFSALDHRHRDKVYRLALRVTRNEARAQDAV